MALKSDLVGTTKKERSVECFNKYIYTLTQICVCIYIGPDMARGGRFWLVAVARRCWSGDGKGIGASKPAKVLPVGTVRCAYGALPAAVQQCLLAVLAVSWCSWVSFPCYLSHSLPSHHLKLSSASARGQETASSLTTRRIKVGN